MGEYYLAHHGIKGQKWGVRRFQNLKGKLTSAGRFRYESQATKNAAKLSGQDSTAYRRNSSLDSKINAKRDEKGKQFVKTLLLGSTGAHTYNMSRAVGKSRIISFINSGLDLKVSQLTSGVIGGVSSRAARKAMVGGHAKTARAIGAIGSVAARGADYGLYRSGKELSLQQRRLRRKYVNGRY